MSAIREPYSGRAQLGPLYAAGFVTAFGAHSVAAGIGLEVSDDPGANLLRVGVLIALYDIAEVLLKPVFGALSDRIGVKPVIVGELVGFAALPSRTGRSRPGVSRTRQTGAGSCGRRVLACKFRCCRPSRRRRRKRAVLRTVRFVEKPRVHTRSPHRGWPHHACGATPPLRRTQHLGYGHRRMGGSCPSQPAPLPRPRYTVIDLVRQTTDRRFLIPTLALAVSTGALGASIGFLPLLATLSSASIFASLAIVSVLTLTSSLMQPGVGALRDRGRLSDGVGMIAGLCVTAAGIMLAAVVPSLATLYAAAVLIGVGIGTTTPLGFAFLAESTPPERIGRTMGSAELGRELGDSAGPLLVGGVATIATLPVGLAALGVGTGLAALLIATNRNSLRTPSKSITEPASPKQKEDP